MPQDRQARRGNRRMEKPDQPERKQSRRDEVFAGEIVEGDQRDRQEGREEGGWAGAGEWAKSGTRGQRGRPKITQTTCAAIKPIRPLGSGRSAAICRSRRRSMMSLRLIP